MKRVGFKTIINILRNKDEKFLRETKNHDKDLIRIIKIYCVLNFEDYCYERDFYKSIGRYNNIVEKENEFRKKLGLKSKPYISYW